MFVALDSKLFLVQQTTVLFGCLDSMFVSLLFSMLLELIPSLFQPVAPDRESRKRPYNTNCEILLPCCMSMPCFRSNINREHAQLNVKLAAAGDAVPKQMTDLGRPNLGIGTRKV